MTTNTKEYNCPQCGGSVNERRVALGYKTCLGCGENNAVEARLGWCVVPMPKSNYILVTDPSLLLGLNSSHKGGMK
jgi:ribosomal protein L37AE/L43A